MTDALNAALTYAGRGWRVVPIGAGTKYPDLAAWQDAATTDPDVIRGWFSTSAGRGVGIATGEASGIFALDVDTAAGKIGAESLADLEATYGPLPPTVEAITGSGGRHLFYRHPAGLELNNSAGRLGPDLDIRANGGQVVAAPTRHPDTGQLYAWDVERHPADVAVADAPPWLLELLRQAPKAAPIPAGDRPTIDHAILARDRYNLAPGADDRVATLLTAAGWAEGRQGRDGTRYFTRPGKATGISATLNRVAPGVLYCWTSSAPPLVAERPYDPFDVYAELAHDGDREKADDAIVDAGWGVSGYGRGMTVLAAPPAPWEPSAPSPFFADWHAVLNREGNEEEWLVDQIIAKGRGHVLYAPHKVGKSLLTLWAALELTTKADDVVVIYLDYEMGEADLQERVLDMGHHDPDALTRLRYALLPMLPPLDTAEGGAALAAIVDTEQAAWPDHHLVVVIDTMGRAMSGEENSADTVRAFYRETGILLKRREVTWLRLDHAGKDSSKGQRGSSAKGDDVDITWKLEATDKGLTLHRDSARMGWVPETVTLERSEDPLAYRVTSGTGWPAGTLELAAKLDELGVPLSGNGSGKIPARKALKDAGVKTSTSLLNAAIKSRKNPRPSPPTVMSSTARRAGVLGNMLDRPMERMFTEDMTTTTATTEPTQHCDTCHVGPFFHVPARTFPTLCLDCAADADRNINGWTPENSAD